MPARRPPAATETARPEAPKDADAALFRAAVADVRPLPRPARVAKAARPRPPRARFRRADEAAVLAESLVLPADGSMESVADALRFRRPQVPERALKRLARGEFAVRAEIDLHGLSRAVAREALLAFLAEAVARRLSCVRVIHGKGLRSGPEGPVLKPAVHKWLREHGAVAAFVSARAVDGGTGALYVLLLP